MRKAQPLNIALCALLLWIILSGGINQGRAWADVTQEATGAATSDGATEAPNMTNTPPGPADPNQAEIAEIRPEAPADILQLISVGTGGQNAEQNCEYVLNSNDVLRSDAIQIEPDTLFFQVQQPAICSDQDMGNTQPYAVSPSGSTIKLTPYSYTFRDQSKTNAITLPLIAYMQPGLWRLGTKNPAIELQINIPVPNQPFFLRGRGDTSLVGGFAPNELVKAISYTFKDTGDSQQWIYKGVVTFQMAKNGYRLLTVPKSHDTSFILVSQQKHFLMANAFFENNGNGSDLSQEQQESLYKAYWIDKKAGGNTGTGNTGVNSNTPPNVKTRTDGQGVAQVWVEAGCYMMGSPNPQDMSAQIKDQAQRQVCITNGFWIDEFEVSNAAYQQFVDAGGYQNQAYWSQYGWQWLQDNNRQGPTDYPNMSLSDPQQPRVGISKFEAEAYAKWRGGRIPTEAEWEYAARGPQSLLYPWGNQYQNGRADIKGMAGGTVDVHSYSGGQSWVGAYNMAGNVGEWVSDCFDATYDNSMVKDNPVGPCDGSTEMVKGSSWAFNEFPAQANYRFVNPPLKMWFDVGLRVVSN